MWTLGARQTDAHASRARSKNECPACRLHLNSRRALQAVRASATPAHSPAVVLTRHGRSRQDPAFDALVAALYGDVVAFEAAEEARIAAENAKNAKVCAPLIVCCRLWA